jgi:hypothetical protein
MVMDLGVGRSWNATETPGRESDCRWTPVDHGLLFLRYLEAGGVELFLQTMTGGDPVNLSRYPGAESVVGFFQLPPIHHLEAEQKEAEEG